MKKALIITMAVIVVAVLGLFVCGYRLTAESAAKANSFVGDAKLVMKTNTSVGETFVFKKNNYYITVAPQKHAFLWVSRISFNTEYTDDKKDPLRLIGWYSVTSDRPNGTVMIAQSHDSRVAYIEAGTGTNRKRAYGDENGIFVLNWSTTLNMLGKEEPTAYANNGDKLYAYSYAKETPNYTDQKELRWYPAL